MVKINQFPADEIAFVNGVFQLERTIRVQLNGIQRTDAILTEATGSIRCKSWSSEYSGKKYFNQFFECKLFLDQKNNRYTEISLRSLKLLPADSANSQLFIPSKVAVAESADQINKLIERYLAE